MVTLQGVHHTARPTWKLKETVDFYQNTLGLKLLHCLVAKKWGPDDQPDFLHFFFDSGCGSTIAFFYYLGTEAPEHMTFDDSYNFRAHHTAWNCGTKEALDEWQARLEAKNVPLKYRVEHEVLEAIYFQDPNGYFIEIARPIRDFNDLDASDAKLSLETFIEMQEEGDGPVDIEQVWARKGAKLDEMQLETA